MNFFKYAIFTSVSVNGFAFKFKSSQMKDTLSKLDNEGQEDNGELKKLWSSQYFKNTLIMTF